jgi:hypothetical protein
MQPNYSTRKQKPSKVNNSVAPGTWIYLIEIFHSRFGAGGQFIQAVRRMPGYGGFSYGTFFGFRKGIF